jgi:hypothetical protein
MYNTRLTIEQRLEALERDTVVLHDTIKLLHKMLKDQGKLIKDYIARKVVSANPTDEDNPGNSRPEDALYTFVCGRRFEKLEREIEKIRKLLDGSRFRSIAG